MKAQIRYVKKTLKYLQWQGLQCSEKRWVLKSPLYLGMERELLEVFPDACLVMTHRHPEEVVPSTCSLWTSFRKPYTDQPIDYHAMVQGTAYQLYQNLAFREQRPDVKILDINYRDIIGSTDVVAEKIYQFAGIDLSEDSKVCMSDWDKDNRSKSRSVHKYSLEEFGLTKDFVLETYKFYIQFMQSRGF